MRTLTSLDREQRSNYEVTVRAQDPRIACYNGQTTLRIQVDDINDNQPKFWPREYHRELRDNVDIGTFVVQVTATDKDTGSNAELTFSLVGSGASNFAIDSDGIIRTAALLTNSLNNVYNLAVIATDGGNPKLTGRASLTVKIIPTNRPPRFLAECAQRGFCNTSVTENQFYRFNLTAVDPDDGPAGHLEYTIVDTNGMGLLQITRSGLLRSFAPLDFEALPVINVTVVVEDGGQPSFMIRTVVLVYIEDVNETPPEFLPCRGSAVENLQPPQRLTQVVPTDRVRFEKLRYRLTEPSVFLVTPNEGVLSVGVSLDRESRDMYDVIVVGSDNGSPPLMASVTCTITVTDANDNAPVFVGTPYEASVNESADIDTLVLTVEATDADEGSNAEVTFSIRDGNAEGAFKIDSQSGEIRTAQLLDRELLDEYNLTIVAQDAGTPTLTATTVVRVEVTDANDNKPMFLGIPLRSTVPESSPAGTFIFDLDATDADAGLNSLLCYTIEGVRPNAQAGVFQVNSTTGIITARTRVFDLASQNLPDIVTSFPVDVDVKVADKGNPSMFTMTTLEVRVTETNQRGIIIRNSFQSVAIPENAGIRSAVAEFQLDQASLFTAPIRYEFVSGNTGDAFAITADGKVRVNNHLDREKLDRYLLTIRLSDSAPQPATQTVRVNVTILDANDNYPVFQAPLMFYAGGVNENAESGQLVVTVLAIDDKDIGTNAQVRYEIVPSGGAEGFAINAGNGQITTTRPFDREALNERVFQVRAIDLGTPPLKDLVTVRVLIFDVNDNAPVFSFIPQNVTVAENGAEVSDVVTVFAVDADTGANGEVSYSLEDASTFSIDSQGVIRTKKVLDRETRAEYKLVVLATDGGTPPQRTNATVTVLVGDLNDNRPEFSPQSLTATIPENARLTTIVLTLNATDQDSGSNGDVKYIITSSTANFPFLLDQSSGDLFLVRPLDFEVADSYRFSVIAEDQGTPTLFRSAEVVITVENIDELAPVFVNDPYAADLVENSPAGIVVLQVSSTDVDSGDDVSYSIISGNTGGAFSLNASSGMLVTAGLIDFEAQPSYTLTLMVRDNTGRNATTTAVITIIDQNDNPPKFVPHPSTLRILDIKLTDLFTFSAPDPDSGSGGTVVYSLVDAVLISTGLHNITVKAEDRGTPRMSTTTHILVLFSCAAPVFSIDDRLGVLRTQTLCSVDLQVEMNSVLVNAEQGSNVSMLCIATSNMPDMVSDVIDK